MEKEYLFGYVVSSEGFIWNKKHTAHLKNYIDPSTGYVRVNLYDGYGNSVPCHIHRAVAELFCDKPEGCTQVNHKDFNRANNHYTNLEWVSPKENIIHAANAGHIGNAKLYDVYRYGELVAENMLSRDIAEMLGIHSGVINCNIQRGSITKEGYTFVKK